MTIHELLQAAGLTANDEIPIWDAEATGEPTKKITAQQLAAAVVALANLVTGVKGNAESSYRTGNVNLTPANIGAVAKSGDTMTGVLKTDSNIIQTTGYIKGEDINNINHAIKLGHAWDDKMQFFEAGGQFDFIKSDSNINTTLFQIKYGVSAYPLPVNNGGTGATDVPGAQNNILSGLFRLYDGGTVSNLAIGNRTAGRVTVYRYGPNTTGAPVSTAAGIAVLGVNLDNANYGWMLSTSDIGMYWRALDGGSYGAWKAIAIP
jgi:hypothetical protein